MKTAIIYESKHHGNTKKLCDAIARLGNVDQIEAKKVSEGVVWADYDAIGFASGIAYGNFYRNVQKAASQIPAGTKTFYLYTCARNDKDFAAGIKAIASGALAIGGLLLLVISILGETMDYWALNSALATICLASLFNLIRLQRKRKEGQKSNARKLEEDHHE